MCRPNLHLKCCKVPTSHVLVISVSVLLYVLRVILMCFCFGGFTLRYFGRQNSRGDIAIVIVIYVDVVNESLASVCDSCWSRNSWD